MLFSNLRITEGVLEALDRLTQRGDLAKDARYELSVVAKVLRHVQHVDISDGEDIRGFGARAVKLLREMQASSALAAKAHGAIRDRLDAAVEAAMTVAGSSLAGDASKQGLIQMLARMDRAFADISSLSPEIGTNLFSEFAPQLLSLHNSLDLMGHHEGDTSMAASSGEPLTEALLTEYFRHKLSDPTAVASEVVTLTGGFGKETSLFTLTSKTLSTDLVMRRDSPIDAFEGLDCHVAPKEYALLGAVLARGFPAPEPLFFEEHPQIIKGPAFSIMRRVPGANAGDATGGREKVEVAAQQVLAKIVARLHALVPLTELSSITAFDPSLWAQGAGECTRRYIASWYEHYKATSHLPTPALHGLFNWLLANVPESDAATTLVHGDIGFHNLMFHEGHLTAVLDWEFAHVGDPAEDLGYIHGMMGGQLDWPQFLADYAAGGMTTPSEQRVRYFEIWANVRNAAATVLLADHFESGRLRDIRLGLIVYSYVPHFIARAEALIAQYHETS